MLNYYGLFDPANRLYPISTMGLIQGTTKPALIQYFEEMSRAMANMCTGRIYTLTQTPNDMARYANTNPPNIWHNVELRALRAHLPELAATLIVIDATDPNHAAWQVDWQTLDVVGPGQIARRQEQIKWQPYNMSAEIKYGPLSRRANYLCEDSGIDDEPADLDMARVPRNFSIRNAEAGRV